MWRRCQLEFERDAECDWGNEFTNLRDVILKVGDMQAKLGIGSVCSYSPFPSCAL